MICLGMRKINEEKHQIHLNVSYRNHMKAGLLAINTHHRGVFYAVGPNGGTISYPECATSSINGNWIYSNTLCELKNFPNIC